MIRAMQLIILSNLIGYRSPSHTTIFMQVCMTFANMDLLDAQGFYQNHFVFTETDPISDQFETMDIED